MKIGHAIELVYDVTYVVESVVVKEPVSGVETDESQT